MTHTVVVRLDPVSSNGLRSVPRFPKNSTVVDMRNSVVYNTSKNGVRTRYPLSMEHNRLVRHKINKRMQEEEEVAAEALFKASNESRGYPSHDAGEERYTFTPFVTPGGRRVLVREPYLGRVAPTQPEQTERKRNKKKLKRKRGCKCALHTEFNYCSYCPQAGCTECSWYGYDNRKDKRRNRNKPMSSFIVCH
jgi:hypothetical protein